MLTQAMMCLFLQHYKASLTATFNLFPVSGTSALCLSALPSVYLGSEAAQSCPGRVMSVIASPTGAGIGPVGQGAAQPGGAAWYLCSFLVLSILLTSHLALQDAKFAVVLEEDLDISVDFFR